MDYLIGAIDYHDWADVCCWHRSALKCGFKGRIVMICYEHLEDSLLRRMERAGIQIVKAKCDNDVNRDRRRDIAAFLEQCQPEDRIMVADVRDVAFAANPSEVLDLALKHKRLFIASEGLRYKDQWWNERSLRTLFPHLADSLLDQEVYCAGVMGGYAADMREFSTTCFAVCKTATGGFGGDQVATNHVIRQPEFRDRVALLGPVDGLIAHYGSTHKASDAAHAKQARFDWKKRWAVNAGGAPFLVFHQYTRGFAVRSAVLLRFGCFIDFMFGKLNGAIRNRLGLGPKWKPFWKA